MTCLLHTISRRVCCPAIMSTKSRDSASLARGFAPESQGSRSRARTFLRTALFLFLATLSTFVTPTSALPTDLHKSSYPLPGGRTMSSTAALPRLILYQQTHHEKNGSPVPLSVLTTSKTGITHIYISAFHINEDPHGITLNDEPPSDERYDELWKEVKSLQHGTGPGTEIKIMGMLGGAARGSYEKLEKDFDTYYPPLRDMLRIYGLQGLDLDVEEETRLYTIQELIRNLRQDFGPDFIITLAPVMPAMLPLSRSFLALTKRILTGNIADAAPIIKHLLRPGIIPMLRHLSGFSYLDLAASPEGKMVNWYNVQCYNGWGTASNAHHYNLIIEAGWDPKQIVLGVLTSPHHGNGYVPATPLRNTIQDLRRKYGDEEWGGIMGWEYWNSDSEAGHFWKWVQNAGVALGRVSEAEAAHDQKTLASSSQVPEARVVEAVASTIDTDAITEDAPDPNAPLLSDAAFAQLLSNLAAANTNSDQSQSRSIAQDGPSRNATIQSLNPTLNPPTLPEDAEQEAKVLKLVEMGFERPEAVAALEAMGGDVDGAAELLFGD